MLVLWRLGVQHLCDPIDPRRSLSRSDAIQAGDQDMDVPAQQMGRGDGFGRGVLQGRVVVIGQYQARHWKTPASVFSLLTNSATELTFTPALR